MLVFYTASYYGKSHYQKYYDLVLDAIRQQQVEILSPELDNYRKVLKKSEIKALGDPDLIHYAAIKKGIKASDAVIIEMSYQDFQIGWEASLACQAKKPVLCLSMQEDFSHKITHPYFHAARYDQYTIDNLVEDFIRKASKHNLKERFNFFLSPAQLEFVKQQSKNTNQTTAQVIRDLIDQSRFND